MLDQAITLVKEYLEEHNPGEEYTLFVVWQVAVLQNFKCLIAVTHPCGMIFEVTFDGDMDSWYVNVYRKTDCLEKKDGIHEQYDEVAN